MGFDGHEEMKEMETMNNEDKLDRIYDLTIMRDSACSIIFAKVDQSAILKISLGSLLRDHEPATSSE